MSSNWLSRLPDVHGLLHRLTFTKGASWGLRKRLYTDILHMRKELSDTQIVADLRQSMLRVGRRHDAGVLRNIYQRLLGGQRFSEAIGSLPPAEKSMLVSGDTKGDLDIAVNQILALRSRLDRMMLTMWASLANPLGYAIVMYVFAYGFGKHLAPTLMQMASPNTPAGAAEPPRLSGAAGTLVAIGEFAIGPGPLLLLSAFIVAAFATARAQPRMTGKLRRFLDRYVFPFTLYRAFQGASWLLNFSMMVAAGMPPADALAEQIRHATPWLTAYLTPIHREVQGGVQLGVALRRVGHSFPSPDLIERIGRLEGIAGFSERMKEFAEEHAARVEKKIMLISAILGGLIFSGSMWLVLLAQVGIDGLIGGGMKHY
ncbi:type II secretion system F family protein [Burkholderia gladioli]|uniref:type II secretion system F family protein n=1 Tax=Burkholderia gladioli TaxID=28095 RepID=UPI00163F6432|nr:type II secretion system F family protein [Burkholderia gladioli]